MPTPVLRRAQARYILHRIRSQTVCSTPSNPVGSSAPEWQYSVSVRQADRSTDRPVFRCPRAGSPREKGGAESEAAGLFAMRAHTRPRLALALSAALAACAAASFVAAPRRFPSGNQEPEFVDFDENNVPYEPILCGGARECGCSGAGTARCSVCPDDQGSQNRLNDVCWCEGTSISQTGNECNPLKVDAPFKRGDSESVTEYQPILCEGAAECGCSGGGGVQCSKCPDDGSSPNMGDSVCWCDGVAGAPTGNECNPRKLDGPFRVANKTTGPRTCTASGDKCAGVPGKPFLDYRSCCDDSLECGVPKNPAAGTWGQFCIAPEDVDTDATAAAGRTPAPTSTTGVSGATNTTVGTTGGTGTGTDPDETLEGASNGDPTDEDDDSVCFPADATVELQSGAVVSMDALSIGDLVKVGYNEYSRVFMFTHKMADSESNFVALETKSGEALTLTPGHYLYVNGALAAAKTVRVGDTLSLGNGLASVVVAVSSAPGTGLYNPQTIKGDIVVNGIVSSTYTTAVEPVLAHAILAPLRLLNTFGIRFSVLESGGGMFARLTPRGKVVV